MYTYTIYFSPNDAPGEYIVRRFDISRGPEPVPLEVLGIVTTLRAARELVPWAARNVCCIRDASDPPAVVETWM